MSSYRVGSGYFGSTAIQTSVANQELLPEIVQTRGAYKLTIQFAEPVNILVNNKYELYVNSVFEITEIDLPINSLKILSGGIDFNFICAY